MADVIRLSGMRELLTATDHAGKAIKRDTRAELRSVAEPVRRDASALATSSIRRIGMKWSGMRIGVTKRAVYVAPKQKGRASRANPAIRRPNLARLLMDRAMQPALDRNEANIVHGLERVIDEVGRDWGTGV